MSSSAPAPRLSSPETYQVGRKQMRSMASTGPLSNVTDYHLDARDPRSAMEQVFELWTAQNLQALACNAYYVYKGYSLMMAEF